MNVLNPDYEAAVRRVFSQAPFLSELGLQLTGVGPGWCESELVLLPKHMQQTGSAHAGVVATVADHTAGGAATTTIAAGQLVLTAEFNMNLLRPASGERLRCRADVLRAGRTLVVVESAVFAVRQGESLLVSKGLFTLAIVSGTI